MIAIIGCGELGSSIIGCLRNQDVLGCDRNTEKLQELSSILSSSTTEISEAIEESEILLLCVPPEDVDDILQHKFDQSHVIVSAVAGLETEDIERKTCAQVVRIMPNLGVKQGESATAVSFGRVQEESREDLNEILRDMGVIVNIEEKRMDLMTAVSGSGIGIVFYLMKCFEKSTRNLKNEKQKKTVSQTFKAAAEIAQNSDKQLEQQVAEVCTDGGTTEEAIQTLEEKKVEKGIKQSIKAAKQKSKEISQDIKT